MASFVENNNMIAIIALLSDWLKNLVPVFEPMRSKNKPVAPCTHDFSLCFEQVMGNNC